MVAFDKEGTCASSTASGEVYKSATSGREYLLMGSLSTSQASISDLAAARVEA